MGTTATGGPPGPQGGTAASQTPAPPPTSPFRTFREYLALSMTDPGLLCWPYTRQDRRVLAYMSWLKRRWADGSPVDGGWPLVSVVVPTGSGSHGIRRSLLSVLHQSMSNLELLLLDDGSDEVATAWGAALVDPRVRHVRVAADRGLAAVRNTGIEQARGHYVAHLDPGDWWDPHFLEVLVRRANQTGHDLVYTAVRELGPPALARGQSVRPEVVRFAPYNASLLENRNYIARIAVLHARHAVLAIGGFEERIDGCIDWDLLLRAAATSPLLGVPVVLAHHDQRQPSSEGPVGGGPQPEQLELDRPPTGPGLSVLTLAGAPSSSDTGGTRVGELYGLVRAASVSSIEMDHRHTTIVIPSFGVPEFLRLCVDSIRAYTTPGTYSLVIVDNGSTEDVQRILDDVEQDHGTTVIRNAENLGFTQAVAQGIEASDPRSDVVVLNNDAVVTPGWLPALHRVPQLHPDAGIVAPRQVLLANNTLIRTHVPGASLRHECDTNLSAHHRNVMDPYFDPRHGITELNFAPFFCVLVRREVIHECGPPDVRMGAHYQSDWVYCEAVREYAGRRILYTPFSKVYHFQGLSTKELRRSSPRAYSEMAEANDWRRVRLRANPAAQ